jgi:hypothetical protein
MEQKAREIFNEMMSMEKDELLGYGQTLLDEVFRRLDHRTKRLVLAEALLREARIAIGPTTAVELDRKIRRFLEGS